MKPQTIESACEALARTAWLLADRLLGVEPTDITATAQCIATKTDCDWSTIRDGILAGLAAMSAEVIEADTAETCIMGECMMGGTPCYWWHTGAESRWQGDAPAWWQDQADQWRGVATD